MASDLIERVARAMHCPDHVAKAFILATLEGMRETGKFPVGLDGAWDAITCGAEDMDERIANAVHAYLDAVRAEVERDG